MFFDHLLKLQSLKFRLLGSTSFAQLYSAEKLPLAKFRKEGAMLSPLIAGLLAACGGGGGDGVVVLSRPVPTEGDGDDQDFTIHVAQGGPTKDAYIYLDVDGDGVRDTDTPVGVTNLHGEAVIAAEHAGKTLLVDLTGAFDTYTGRQFDGGTYTLNVDGLTVASPYVSLIRSLVDADNGIDTVQQAIDTIFDNDGLVTLEDLNNIDNYKVSAIAPDEDLAQGSADYIKNIISTGAIFLQHYLDAEEYGDLPPIEEFVITDTFYGLPTSLVPNAVLSAMLKTLLKMRVAWPKATRLPTPILRVVKIKPLK